MCVYIIEKHESIRYRVREMKTNRLIEFRIAEVSERTRMKVGGIFTRVEGKIVFLRCVPYLAPLARTTDRMTDFTLQIII